MPVYTISQNKSGVGSNRHGSYAARTHGDSKESAGPRRYEYRARQRSPRLDLVSPDGAVAVDCEGTILGDETGPDKNGLGRVSIVNEAGPIVYDVFAYYPKGVNNRPPPQRLGLGVKYNDIKPENGALPISQVLKAVKSIFDKAGIVVGHAIANERNYLRGISWINYQTRNTPTYYQDRYDSGKLSLLSSEILGWSIQQNEHSSVEDAQATMELYLRNKELIDSEQSGCRGAAPATVALGSEPSRQDSVWDTRSSAAESTIASSLASLSISASPEWTPDTDYDTVSAADTWEDVELPQSSTSAKEVITPTASAATISIPATASTTCATAHPSVGIKSAVQSGKPRRWADL